MNEKFATELAYNNGYEKGMRDFAKELKSRCMNGGIYPAFLDAKINEILDDMSNQAKNKPI
jgi:hypothetical protein